MLKQYFIEPLSGLKADTEQEILAQLKEEGYRNIQGYVTNIIEDTDTSILLEKVHDTLLDKLFLNIKIPSKKASVLKEMDILRHFPVHMQDAVFVDKNLENLDEDIVYITIIVDDITSSGLILDDEFYKELFAECSNY